MVYDDPLGVGVVRDAPPAADEESSAYEHF